MNRKTIKNIASLTLALLVLLSNLSQAHEGRRLEVLIADNQLYAQGYLSGANPIDDQGGIVRPYTNAIHGHFDSNDPANQIPFIAGLPGFDLFEIERLRSADLTIELLGARKWENPIVGATPLLTSLDADETIEIGFGFQPTINTVDLGGFTFADSITRRVSDIDLTYSIETDPADTLYALEWRLATSQPGIADSDSVYTILSPPGTGPVERLHFQSLALEANLGISTVPEPGALFVLGIGGLLASTRRRSRN